MLLGDLEPGCDPEEPSACEDAGGTCATVLGTFPVCQDATSTTSGSFGAWLLLMGQKLSGFAPELGFDPWHNLKQALDRNIDFFANPVAFPALLGIGDRVSYAFWSGEGMRIPNSYSSCVLEGRG